ncbi:MAG TPA: hypothetical protein DCF68_20720 [Cyanothece sp. UBA12306]|nr:hypothetical protein [Cyanothece sp. UBA12306]
MLKNYLKLLTKSRQNSGYSLAELIVAASFSFIVVSASIGGLIIILRENKVALATSQTQSNINQAAQFVSAEIQNADSMETDLTTLGTNAPTYDTKKGTSNGRIPVLALKIPGVPERVVYYLEPASSSAIWQPPYILRRFGPGFNLDGTYDSDQFNPGGWDGEALIDGISDSSTGTTTCDAGFTRLPTNSSDIKGFFVCVQTGGKLAKFYLTGTSSNQLKSIGKSNDDSRYGKKMNYQVVTQAFAAADYSGAVGLTFPDFGLYDSGIVPETGGSLNTSSDILDPSVCLNAVTPSIHLDGSPSGGSTFSGGETITFDISCGGTTVSSSDSNHTKYYTDGKKLPDTLSSGLLSLIKSQLPSGSVNGDGTLNLPDNKILYLLDVDGTTPTLSPDAHVLVTIDK